MESGGLDEGRRSDEVEGWRVEAWMRADARMGLRDIIARLPSPISDHPAGHRVPMMACVASRTSQREESI